MVSWDWCWRSRNYRQKWQDIFAPNLDWHQADLKHMIEAQFQVPVEIENEANVGSHGERLIRNR